MTTPGNLVCFSWMLTVNKFPFLLHTNPLNKPARLWCVSNVRDLESLEPHRNGQKRESSDTRHFQYTTPTSDCQVNFSSRGQGLNPRPLGYKPKALPTELPRQTKGRPRASSQAPTPRKMFRKQAAPHPAEKSGLHRANGTRGYPRPLTFHLPLPVWCSPIYLNALS